MTTILSNKHATTSRIVPKNRTIATAFLALFAVGMGCDSTVPKNLESALVSLPSYPARVESLSLQQKIEFALRANLEKRLLSAESNGTWQVIHGAVAYGDQLPLEVDGKVVNAIDYLLSGGVLPGWELSVGPILPATSKPGILARVEAGSYIGQGHTDQWLGYFSQIPLSLDRAVQVNGQPLTIRDWARQAQWDVPTNPFQEYSWTLIALTNFFPEEQEWKANDGNTWTLEPFVRWEANQDLTASPCGGMHRLMGLAHAIQFRKRHNGLFDGGWLLAKNVVASAVETAKRFQNSDGSFSTKYTERPGVSKDMSASISATGHTLEFLAYALEERELAKPWMERAVERLCDMLKATEKIELECGGAYHALAGLNLYYRRRFQKSTTD